MSILRIHFASSFSYKENPWLIFWFILGASQVVLRKPGGPTKDIFTNREFSPTECVQGQALRTWSCCVWHNLVSLGLSGCTWHCLGEPGLLGLKHGWGVSRLVWMELNLWLSAAAARKWRLWEVSWPMGTLSLLALWFSVWFTWGPASWAL